MICHTQTSKFEEDPKPEDHPKNEDNLENEDDLDTEEPQITIDNQKNKIRPKKVICLNVQNQFLREFWSITKIEKK